MQLLSINVSKPKIRRLGLKFYTSAFLKTPVTGPVAVQTTNIDGDKQADLLNHGGLDKAIYGFSADHYDYWKSELNREDISPGKFGENLTISGLNEDEIAIGDKFQINDCILEVSQPRIPCYKISFEFKHPPMLNSFIDHAHTGVYFRVLQAGTITANQPVELIEKHPENLTVKDLFRAHFDSQFDRQEQVMRQSVEIPELAEAWKSKMRDKLHLIDLYYQRQKKN